ncbi:MAG: DNA repair protein RecN, partial [Chloroflexota bacterium]|nr:DNA repair protein RecN [Chloroflexota bacterium]
MLVELGIRNFAIIDDLRLSFEGGLNAITGATGAGKSIIIDALGAVLGERIGADVVRTGAASAHVEAVFDLREGGTPGLEEILADLGVELDDGTLILSRQIAANGRSTARINGTTQTVSALGAIGAFLIDIHGQSDHLKLLRTNEQLAALDHYAETTELRQKVAGVVGELAEIRRQRAALRTGEREREQRVDLLRYQVEEISTAALQPGEDEALERDRAVLANAERLVFDAQAGVEALESEEGGAVTGLRQALLAIGRLAEIDRSAVSLEERANEVVILADELASDLRRYADTIDADPARLAELDERIDLIQRLKRKYGATIEEINTHLAEAEAELDRLSGGEFNDERLAGQEAALRERLRPLVADLTARRAGAARKLELQIDDAIAELGLGSAHVRIQFTASPEPTETGAESVEFLFAPNAGESLKPLARIASGGETARLMLALKSVLAAADRTPSLVFDEVDVGVGARSGQAVGEKLWSLAGDHQVIV